MKKKLSFTLIVLGLILLPNFISAQSYWKQNYKEADGIAAKTKKTKDIAKLSNSLTASLNNTADKYRAIFSWIALNISYDVKGLKNYSNVPVEPVKVISAGKTVCEGYSNLFKALCDASGLPCVKITGWTKNMPEKIGKPFTKYTTHAWNAIQINQKWYSCDATWGAGSLDDATQKFNREFNDFYFCMPDRLFFLNHYPEDTKWMFGYKISQSEFINNPHFFNPVLEWNIKSLEPSTGTIKFKKKQSIKFNFSIEETIQSVLIKMSNSPTPKQITFKQKKNNISFEYQLDQYGPFLYVFLNNKGAIVYRMEK